jgi:uncharacterized protein HemY
MDLDELEQALLAAHAAQDLPALVTLYTTAADAAASRQDHDAACFYLTHAFVFALEAGAPEAPALNKRLADQGRAHLIDF